MKAKSINGLSSSVLEQSLKKSYNEHIDLLMYDSPIDRNKEIVAELTSGKIP